MEELLGHQWQIDASSLWADCLPNASGNVPQPSRSSRIVDSLWKMIRFKYICEILKYVLQFTHFPCLITSIEGSFVLRVQEDIALIALARHRHKALFGANPGDLKLHTR